MLDWYINPDHAPIMVAEQIGAFKAEGLDVKIVPPSDPALPPRLVAAKQADLAITYQPQLHFFADQGLPLMRVGTLINTPLNTVIALDKNITSPADLKGQNGGLLGQRHRTGDAGHHGRTRAPQAAGHQAHQRQLPANQRPCWRARSMR